MSVKNDKPKVKRKKILPKQPYGCTDETICERKQNKIKTKSKKGKFIFKRLNTAKQKHVM
jgi:hypothetical protein